jgi:hypothetical protein
MEVRQPHTNATMSQWQTTHPQPHEQLLVGWLVGGATTGRKGMRGNSNDTHDHDHCRPTNHHHKQLLMGEWGATGRGGDGDDDREGEKRGGRNQEGCFDAQWPKQCNRHLGPW